VGLLAENTDDFDSCNASAGLLVETAEDFDKNNLISKVKHE
jgi:hypothetical protein